ncbi:MAG: hypothetical protein M3421_03395, partial [Bacteroidota bacterium]|nr:hypothetical protein [Bacteroidota bacterium]
LFFDREMNFKNGGFVQMSEAGLEDGTNKAHEKLSQEFIAEEPGYVYIYLSNDGSAGSGEVFFDDFSIMSSESYIVQTTDYYPYGLVASNWVRQGEKATKDLFQGKTYEELTQWSDFHARQYDAALGRWLGVDPQNQFASPYLAMGNNPVMMVDPDGELAWFVPMIIGAVIGGTAGGIHASNDPNMSIGQGILLGATIGGLSGGAAAGVSAIGGGAMLAGAAGGAVGGAGFSGMGTGWDGQAMLRGAAIGAASGFVGGGFASAIGGGGGAFVGGAAADITGQLLSTGDVNLGQSLLAGGMSFGMYHAMSYGSYKFGGGNTEIAGRKFTYRQFNKINTAYQRSRFWKKEHGVYLNNDGSARFVPRNDRHKFHVTFDDWQQGDFGTFHSHWAKPGTEWANIGGAGKWHRYDPLYNHPAGSYKVTAVGNSFSPGDISGLIGNSYVAGRTGAHYMLPGGTIGQFSPDPFLRFSLFPWWYNY